MKRITIDWGFGFTNSKAEISEAEYYRDEFSFSILKVIKVSSMLNEDETPTDSVCKRLVFRRSGTDSDRFVLKGYED